MGEFAQMLQQVVLNRPVIDKTGLAGRFDFGIASYLCAIQENDSVRYTRLAPYIYLYE